MGKTLNDVGTSLLEELAAEIAAIEELKPDDVTVDRLCAKTGKKRCFVERLLQEKVRVGEYVCVSVYNPETGRRANAYRVKG